MITIEPMAMVATSETLRLCSVEAADIRSQLWSCSQCPMPADVEGAVGQLVVVLDQALDSVATDLLAQALDLTRRALIAISDSQLTTSVAGESVFGGQTTTGPSTDIGIAGWSAFDGMTIMAPGDLTSTWLDGMDGGTSTISVGGDLTRTWMAGMDGGTSTISVGGDLTSTWLAGMSSPNISASALLGGIGGSTTGLNLAMGINDAIYHQNMHTLSTSWADLDDAAGKHLLESEVRRVSPFTLPTSMNSFW